MICEKGKFVFVHVPKTGGTSVRYTIVKVYPTKLLRKLDIAHPGVRDYMHYLGEDRFREMFSFAFVRNPWDRILSRYFAQNRWYDPDSGWKKASGSDSPPSVQDVRIKFERWLVKVRRFVQKQRKPITVIGPRMYFVLGQYEQLQDYQGNVGVTYLGRYEKLKTNWVEIATKLGLSKKLSYHIAKTKRGDYKKYYTDQSRKIVEELCEDDIRKLRYKFE